MVQIAELPQELEIGEEHIVQVSKDAGRQLNEDKMRQQVDSLIASINTVQRQQRGWRIELRLKGYNRDWFDQRYNRDSAITGAYLYHVALRITCSKPDAKTSASYFQNIVNAVDTKGSTYPGNPWRVTEVDGSTYVPKASEDMSDAQLAAEIGYVPIQLPDAEDWDAYFEGLFGLEAHIARAKRAIDNGIRTNFQSRVHTLFIGPPGCGKSDICQRIKAALGEESVMEFDATSTTLVGAQAALKEREELPRVLIVEEIEKAPNDAMQFLLSILDLRGEVRRTTARGNIFKDTKMVAIATVNDYEMFQRQMAGALASRFSNKVWFKRPSRELLGKILLREVRKFDGKEEWIEPTLDFAEELGTTDPREVIALMLTGRDDLLDGSYQADVRSTTPELDAGWDNLPALP